MKFPTPVERAKGHTGTASCRICHWCEGHIEQRFAEHVVAPGGALDRAIELSWPGPVNEHNGYIQIHWEALRASLAKILAEELGVEGPMTDAMRGAAPVTGDPSAPIQGCPECLTVQEMGHEKCREHLGVDDDR